MAQGALPRGVTLHKTGRYQAQIRKSGHNHYLGLFDCPDEAAAAYRAAAKLPSGGLARGGITGSRRHPNYGKAQRFLSKILDYEGDDCLLWPFAKTEKGYGKIWFEGRFRIVSRLVCEMANGAPPTPDHHAAHSCGRGNLGCVSPLHVSWKTARQNADDKFAHGTHATQAAERDELGRFLRWSPRSADGVSPW